MLHHLSIGVKDLDKSGRFYDAALEALGFRRVFEDETAIGYGVEDGKDKFCLKLRPDAVAPVLVSIWRSLLNQEVPSTRSI